MPPRFSWIAPPPFSVITTSTVRLAIDADDDENGSGIGKVTFYARYFDFNGELTEKKKIGETDRQPYEIIWDCSRIPDQNMHKLLFSCDVLDRAGNITNRDINNHDCYSGLVLDRNPSFRTSRLQTTPARRKIVLDGILQEWTECDSIRFANNDNRITVYSLWDKQFLYFAARIEDRSIISFHRQETDDISGMPIEDVLEIYLDTKHTHSEMCVFPDRHFLFSPAGKAYEVLYFRDSFPNTEVNTRPDIQAKMQVRGTVNRDQDVDSSCTVEIALSWKNLGVYPEDGKTIGMEIWNADRDFCIGGHSYAGWTTTASNLKNPSEWGDLVITGPKDRFHPAMIFLPITFFGVVALTGALYTLRKRSQRAAMRKNTLPVTESGHIKKAYEFIADHYADDSLTREMAASHIGLDPSYFGKLFKKETGTHFTDYLVNYRIEKAQSMLMNTRKSISEITFAVGFNSQSYFGYVFKKKVGLSPKQYRAKAESEDQSPHFDILHPQIDSFHSS
ncbi:MAG: helix-turn-helix domain-containing protein [Candidatus Latescibacterota bacterium]